MQPTCKCYHCRLCRLRTCLRRRRNKHRRCIVCRKLSGARKTCSMRCYNKWYWQQISMRAGLLKRHRARMMVNYYKRRERVMAELVLVTHLSVKFQVGR
jgi:hypothetical protein